MLYMLMNLALLGYMAPDDGDGGGSGGSGGSGGGDPPAPPTPPDPPDKTYSQKEKDADEAKLRRRYERELKEMKRTQTEQAEAIAAYKKKSQNPIPPSIQPPGTPPNADGRLELMEKKFARTQEELTTRVQAAEESAEKEKQSRLRLQRDQLLDDAIRAAGVMSKHATQARRFFLSQVEWDDLEGADGDWVFRTQKGNLVPIMDGVIEELPDNLKPSKMRSGGAGNTPGIPQSQQLKQRTFEEEKKKLTELKAAFRRGGGKNADMMAFTKQKKKVEALEQGLLVPK